MSEQFEMIAKTFQGLEEILAEELTTLGANDIQIGRRMVSFTGDKRMMYKANFCLRTAIRILKPIKNFTAKDADEVYNQIQAIPWEEYLDVNKTFAIDAVVFSEEFRHSKFVSYKVKDAIVDYFRKKTGKRPSVRINNPDVLLNIHIAQTTCTLSLDSSGESLHRRGYRQEQVDAPLNEVLAAGMLLMTGWRGECDLIDPMCGSGTIPIEAALIARNIAPGVFRKGFAFEKWVDFDSEMFDEIYNDDSQEREFTHKIYGYDNNPKANEIATHNIKAAGVSKDVTLKLQPFQQFEQPQEKSIIVMNPPYGGNEKEGVKQNFPADLRSSETADLFMSVIMYRLKQNGRCAIILPDGFLFGTDNAKMAIKEKLLSEFNLHTVIRMPHSVFAPYTSITTNILFFDRTHPTTETWFYRLDMPEGYKNFSKTKPMKLEHFAPTVEWLDNREEITIDGFDKAKKYTVEELKARSYNIDLCGYPHEEEEILPPKELIQQYQEKRASLNADIDRILAQITDILGIDITEEGDE